MRSILPNANMQVDVEQVGQSFVVTYTLLGDYTPQTSDPNFRTQLENGLAVQPTLSYYLGFGNVSMLFLAILGH